MPRGAAGSRRVNAPTNSGARARIRSPLPWYGAMTTTGNLHPAAAAAGKRPITAAMPPHGNQGTS